MAAALPIPKESACARRFRWYRINLCGDRRNISSKRNNCRRVTESTLRLARKHHLLTRAATSLR